MSDDELEPAPASAATRPPRNDRGAANASPDHSGSRACVPDRRSSRRVRRCRGCVCGSSRTMASRLGGDKRAPASTWAASGTAVARAHVTTSSRAPRSWSRPSEGGARNLPGGQQPALSSRRLRRWRRCGGRWARAACCTCRRSTIARDRRATAIAWVITADEGLLRPTPDCLPMIVSLLPSTDTPGSTPTSSFPLFLLRLLRRIAAWIMRAASIPRPGRPPPFNARTG